MLQYYIINYYRSFEIKIPLYAVFDIHNNFTYPDNNAVMAKRRVSKYEKCFHQSRRRKMCMVIFHDTSIFNINRANELI